MRFFSFIVIGSFFIISCGKDNSPEPSPPVAKNISVSSIQINSTPFDLIERGIGLKPVITIRFTQPVLPSSLSNGIQLKNGSEILSLNNLLQQNDSVLIIRPVNNLLPLTKYQFVINSALKSASNGGFTGNVNNQIFTGIDSSRKFPIITDEALLDLVQRQTFKYFWDFAHPVSGLARERNTSGDIVTSGGSGFGIMCIPVAIERNFITRAQGLERMQKIVGFLKNNAVKVKGAFSHWLNGSSGAIVPFSANDNGADLVETSFLMMGLLTARQYFNEADAAETTLRNDINDLYSNVEWDWFRNGNQNVLYWHYSNDKGWTMNLPVRGWNETLITYVMAASSPTHAIPKAVYDEGFARSGAMRNGKQFYGISLPLGEDYGGPLFFSHYSFLGINPNGLADAYANYGEQTKNHSLINFTYSKTNPQNYFGYSDSVWGLTASDISGGYTASSPLNDRGVIAPTAALSSMPYTPAQSMGALKFYYFVLGDKLWKDYGFIDAFSLHDLWFADSFLAIDQGPIIIMIENHRSKLLWNLFTSSSEVKAGLKSLGFSAPYL